MRSCRGRVSTSDDKMWRAPLYSQISSPAITTAACTEIQWPIENEVDFISMDYIRQSLRLYAK